MSDAEKIVKKCIFRYKINAEAASRETSAEYDSGVEPSDNGKLLSFKITSKYDKNDIETAHFLDLDILTIVYQVYDS